MPIFPTAIAEGVPVTNPATVVAVPVPEGAPETPRVKPANTAINALKTHDVTFTDGLSATIAKSIEHHPMRICILDNSGSMRASDGKVLVRGGGGKSFKTIGCTRWRELKEDAVAIAKMSAALGARTDFHMLNAVPGFAASSVCTDAWSGGVRPLGRTVDVPELERALTNVQPNGTTPLTEAVMNVVSMLQPVAPQLRASGQAVAVLICTDGLPNDSSSFLRAMRMLQALPVWTVVRLVTDDDGVVNYWNDLDSELEAPLEVLDDVRGEAQEVVSKNPWLNYAPPLHQARLFGLPDKLFDELDESPLLPSQIARFLRLLLGAEHELPEPEVDPAAFLEAVRLALLDQPPAFDPRSGKMKPWVSMSELDRALRRARGEWVCAIM